MNPFRLRLRKRLDLTIGPRQVALAVGLCAFTIASVAAAITIARR